MRDGSRHPLHRAVRAALLLLSLASLGFGLHRFAATVEQVRHAGSLALPEAEAPFRETLVGALATAVVTFDFDGGIRQALAERDYQKAETLYRVALSFGRPLSADVSRDYGLATSGWAVVGRNAWDFARGSVTGYGEGAFGLVGAVGADLLIPLYGDARDAGMQLWRHVRGQEIDRVILGLAAVGLALPVAQAATDPLKAALRFVRANPRLLARLRGLDGAAVRSVAGDVAGIFASGGRRATVAALRSAETAEDLTVFRRVARTFGAEADGYISVLGRRSGMMYRTWRLTLPLAAKLLALGSLLSLVGALLAAALSHSAALKLARLLGLRWLARWLTTG